MNLTNKAKMCRCGHHGRWHLDGTIWQGYQQPCQQKHSTDEYGPLGCLNFEAVDKWQELFADALRSEGYVVERVVRDERGRFVPATTS